MVSLFSPTTAKAVNGAGRFWQGVSRWVAGTDRQLRRLRVTAAEINALEPDMEALSAAAMRDKTDEFRDRLAAGETLDDLLVEAFAVVREAGKRTLGQRMYDVQLMAGMVLHSGKIAEMRTGEGKTLVATLPLYLNALTGRGCHLVTPNDYLSRIGGGWMGPIYHALGVSVGVIAHEFGGRYDPDYQDPQQHGDPRLDHWRQVSRQEAYAADVTYGTNHEFGFDYLRDNMVLSLSQMVQRPLHYAIVDEVDNILIDEARTPLIISGPAEEPPDTYYKFARIVNTLAEDRDFTVDLKLKAVSLTDEGIDRVERQVGVDNIYGEGNYHLVHYLEQALKAKVLFQRDSEYVLCRDGRVLDGNRRDANADVVIVDEFTGRLMHGRRYSEGLHQAIEAKEGVRIQRENLTMATITFQNYFRLYEKLAGMTGTAATEAEEFRKIYNLDVTQIPTHRPMVRQDFADQVYKHEQAKYEAIIREIELMQDLGRPVLVGTTSVEKSEQLALMLNRRGISHQVLNAKQHEGEALVVAQAGSKDAVTIATNMAGRGTDIILGGSPPDAAATEAVRGAGGLHIIGTERHEARRIDNQLRGRAGRQGDPGSSRFYLSLDDDLMRRFVGSERIAGIIDRLGLEDDQPIEHGLVTKSIETAQTKVEGYNFDIRKYTVEYDDVMNRQREVIYGQRRRLLAAESISEVIGDLIGNELDKLVAAYCASDRQEEWDREGLWSAFSTLLALPTTEVPAGSDASLLPATLDGLMTADGNDLSTVMRDLTLEALKDSEEIKETLHALALDLATAREQVVGTTLMSQVQRQVALQVVDGLWVEHLTAIEDMKQGIGLRAYGQRDPLTEYKSEAYRLFQSLMENVQHNIVRTLFHLPLPTSGTNGAAALDEANRRPRQMFTNNPVEQAATQAPAAVRSGRRKKIGRNAPCPCGSGKKYKRCHGR